MITSPAPSTEVWLPLTLLVELAARFGHAQPITIEECATGEKTTRPPVGPLAARLLHHGNVIAHVHDEQFAAALTALLDAVPKSLLALAQTCVDVLRQHSTSDDSDGRCRECGQRTPCGTRTLVQKQIGQIKVPQSALTVLNVHDDVVDPADQRLPAAPAGMTQDIADHTPR